MIIQIVILKAFNMIMCVHLIETREDFGQYSFKIQGVTT
jgi:hypothetical protein